MIVDSGPASLTRVSVVSGNSIFSRYVPGATSTLSPSEAASIPAWIVGWSAGTWIVSAKEGKGRRAIAAAKETKLLDFMVSPESARIWAEEANVPLPVVLDTSDLDVSPLFKTVLDVLNSASAGDIELGYNIDVLVPASFNEVMQSGFQAVLAGDKTPEQQAADMQAAWEAAITK